MACRYIRFEWEGRPASEWTPMGLRDARCLLRTSNPEKWTRELRLLGIGVEETNLLCLHNLTASWETCPLFAARRAREEDAAESADRNEFGYPLQV